MEIINTYYTHHDRWLAMAYRLTSDKYISEDLVQDMYLKIGELVSSGSKKPEELKYNDDPNVYYAFCIIRNAYLNLVKYEQRYSVEHKEYHSDAVGLNDRLLRDDVRSIISQLCPRQQRVYQLSIESDHTLRSLAKATGYSPQTMYKDKKYIKQLLQKWLQDETR